jgi:hypothetical protein
MVLRALAWMLTLTKLNEPADFQAVVAASGVLFEIAVDTVLLARDPTAYATERIIAWEDSAKLKTVLQAIECFTEAGRELPQECEPMRRYACEQRARIEQLRATYWRATTRTAGRDGSSGRTPPPTVCFPRARSPSSTGRSTRAAAGTPMDPGWPGCVTSACPSSWGSPRSRSATCKVRAPHRRGGARALSLWDETVEREFTKHRDRSVVAKYVTAFGQRG